MQASFDSNGSQPPLAAEGWASAYLEASLILARTPDPVDMLRALLRFAGPGFTAARLGLIDASAPSRARIIAELEGGAVRSASYPERMSDYPGWDTLAEREVIVPDVQTTAGLSSEQRDRLRARRIGSLVIAPLAAEGEVLGVLILTHPAPQTFDAGRLRALRVLLDQAARGLAARDLQSALIRERERSQRFTRQLDAVSRLALRSSTFETSQDLYEFAVRELVALLGADHGGVLVLDPDEVAGTVVAEYPDSGALGSRLVMAGNEIFDQVRAQRGAPVIVNHIADDPRMLPDTRAVFQRIGLRSIMFIPVVLKGRIVSSIGMDLFTDEREFAAELTETAQAMAAQISSTLENLERAEQLTRQLRAVESMSALTTSIYRLQESERTLFASIAEEVTHTTESDHLVIALIEPDGLTVTVAGEYPDRGLSGVQMELAGSLMAEPVRQLRVGVEGPIVLGDLQTSANLPEPLRTPLQQFDVHAMLFAPLRVNGKLAGIAAFDRSGANRPYEPEVVNMARTIGVELSVGLQNIRLVQDARRRAGQLERIAEFTRVAQSFERIEPVLENTVSTLRDLVPADRIGVLIYDDTEQELRLAALYQDGAASLPMHSGPLVAVNGTYAGQVWSSQQPLAVADALEGVAGRARGDIGIRSMLLFPFSGGPNLRGVLSVGSALPEQYSDSDAAVIQQLVNQFSSSLESRATLAARQTAAERESLLNALGARYQRSIDVNDMLSLTLRELGDHLGAKRGRIRLALEPAPVEWAGEQDGTAKEVW